MIDITSRDKGDNATVPAKAGNTSTEVEAMPMENEAMFDMKIKLLLINSLKLLPDCYRISKLRTLHAK